MYHIYLPKPSIQGKWHLFTCLQKLFPMFIVLTGSHRKKAWAYAFICKNILKQFSAFWQLYANAHFKWKVGKWARATAFQHVSLAVALTGYRNFQVGFKEATRTPCDVCHCTCSVRLFLSPLFRAMCPKLMDD